MFKRMKNRVKKMPLYWRMEKVMLLCAVTIQCAMTPLTCYALGDTQLVKGTKNLLNDGMLVLIGIEAAAVALCCAVQGLKWKFGPEEHKPKCINNIKSTIGIGIFVICLTGVVPAIFSYYTS